MVFKGQQYLIILLSLFLFIYKNFKRKELFVLTLFKVFKGAAQGLNSQALSDGYCWFTYDDGKFYIDYKDPTDQQLKRKALNANMADSDKFGDLINETYAVNLELTSNNLDNILTLYSKNDIVLATVSLSKPIFIINFYDSIGDADYDGNNRFRLITDPQDLANAIDKYADGDCILQCAVQDIDTIEVYNNHYIFTLLQSMHLFYTIVFPDISDLTHVVYKYFGFIGSNPTNSQIQRGEISLASGEDFESFQNFLLVELQNLAGTGLTLENKAVGDYTVSVLNHSNSVTANASYPTGTAVSANGGKITVRDIKYDAQGHITGSQDREITLSQTTYTVGNKALKIASDSGTATQAITTNESSADRTTTIKGDGTYITGAVSGSANAPVVTLSHMDPVAASDSKLIANASGATAAWSIDVVKGVTLERDAKGHVTNLTVTSGKIPANPNTTYTLSGALSSDNKTFVTTLTPSSGNATTATVPVMTKATASAAGKAGLVPIPSAGAQTKFLRGDGTWQTAYTLPIAATDALGGIKIGTGLDINSSGVVSVDISDLGLSSAMHFIGVTETEIEDGDGHKDSYAGISDYTSETSGDVILYDDAEFVWTGSYWELLGDKGSFKIKQTAIENNTGTADGNNTSTTFIYSISQNANGEISAKSRKLPTASTSTAGIMTTDMVTKLNGIQESADAVSFTRSLTSGTKVGTITINGTGTDIYAPTNTDTKNTAGSTNTSNKIFLIGATSQATNPQTYSDDQVFTTSGVLTAKELVLSQTGARSITFSRTDGYNYIQTPAGGGVAICATDNSVSLVGSTLLVNATNVRPGQTNTYDLGTSSNKWKTAYVTTLNSDDIIVDNLTASQAVSTDANKKLVSTNLAVSDPTASGTGITYIATISQSAVGKITVTKSTVRSASTSQTGVVQLSSAINSTSETSAATAKAVKTAYDLANTANTTANSHKYWANIESTSAAAYNKTPEVASIKINGDTSASAASTKNVQLTYDSTDDSINFNFI